MRDADSQAVSRPSPAPGARTAFSWESDGPGATERAGELLGRRLARDRGAAVLLLSGELGAGKTAFVRGLARGLGTTTPARSPTFALEHIHRGERTLHHLDLYRLASGPALDELGLEELFTGDQVTAVEWPDRLGDLRPSDALTVTFTVLPGERRRLDVEGPAPLVDAFRRELA